MIDNFIYYFNFITFWSGHLRSSESYQTSIIIVTSSGGHLKGREELLVNHDHNEWLEFLLHVGYKYPQNMV